MRPRRTTDRRAPDDLVRRWALHAAVGPLARRSAEPSPASAAPLAGLIVANVGGNLYSVRLGRLDGGGLEDDGELIEAANLAEPPAQTGQLAAGDAVLLWPCQGRYVMFAAPPYAAGSPGYWAKVIGGSGPSYTVRPQVAAGESEFSDDGETVTAVNVWELTVDPSATAAVPGNAVVRVWEEPDSQGATRRFFSYPIHAVYR